MPREDFARWRSRAERILARTPSIVDDTFLASVDQQLGLDLERFGVRQTTVALRKRSADRLLGHC